MSCSERELWSFLPFCADRSSSLVMYARLILRQIQAFPPKKNRGNVRACMQAVIDRSGGGVLLAASEYCMAKLWCPESDECTRTLEGHKICVMSAALSPDGDFFGGEREWSAESGECFRTLEVHQDSAMSAAFSSFFFA